MLQLSMIQFKRGSYIFVEGKTENDRFYIIQKGQVRCFKELEVDNTASILGPGDFVGVISCFAVQSQVETVVAITDVQAIAVGKENYPELIKTNTPVALKIIRTFAKRMRTLNEKLTQLTLNNIATATPEQLYTIATYYEKAGQRDSAIYGYYQYMKECSHGVNIEAAKQRFVALKSKTTAVYFETTNESVRSYPKGTMIFSECQSGGDMFIIQSGKIRITKIVDNNEIILAVLEKGDFFGEMALLENKPRSASAIAHEQCTLMVINRNNFDIMVKGQPQLIARLTNTLAKRLWSMSRQLTNTLLKDPKQKFIDMLALQIEKDGLYTETVKNHQFDLTIYDLATMCGVPKEEQAAAFVSFMNDNLIKIINNKIFVTDCNELIRTATFYRNQQKKINDKKN